MKRGIIGDRDRLGGSTEEDGKKGTQIKGGGGREGTRKKNMRDTKPLVCVLYYSRHFTYGKLFNPRNNLMKWALLFTVGKEGN